MPNVSVVHLVWKPLGVETFHRFLSSYKQMQGGLDHQLIMLFNGFDESKELEPYLTLLADISHERLILPRRSQDIPAYFAAAERVTSEFVCFLNSHSVLLDEEWLAKMYFHLTRENVGVVGATGSYHSYYCSVKESMSAVKRGYTLRRFAGSVRRQWTLNRLDSYFDHFPNPHIRSNAFMLARDLMLGLERGRMRTKMQAMRFESGKNNFTRQIQQKGLSALVVGRDGKAYEQENWFESETYKSGDQSNLLVADNRTKQYAEADTDSRKMMTKTAWGR